MVKGSLEPSASLQCEGPQDADATFSSLIFPRRPEYKQRIIYGSVFCLVVASLQTILVLLALGKLGVWTGPRCVNWMLHEMLSVCSPSNAPRWRERPVQGRPSVQV